MPGPGISLSIVICTRNRWQDLLDTLASIARQSRLPDEILIVDSSDGDETKKSIEGLESASLRPRLRYVRAAQGLTHQRNVGAREFRGDIAIYLDDDVILEADYIAAIAEVFSDSSIHGAGGISLAGEQSGAFGGLFRKLFLLPQMDGEGRMQRSGFPAWSRPPKNVQPVEILSGYNMAYRREVLEALQFNEEMTGYGLMEDVEFSHRASKRFRFVLTPRARLTHKRSSASREEGRAIFCMRTYHHFLIYRSSVHRGPDTLVCFLWAHVGVLVWAGIESLKTACVGPIRGYFEGLRYILFPASRPQPAVPKEGTQ